MSGEGSRSSGAAAIAAFTRRPLPYIDFLVHFSNVCLALTKINRHVDALLSPEILRRIV